MTVAARLAAFAGMLAVAACSAAGPTAQTESIPAGSGTLGTLASGNTRVEQGYTGTLAASGDKRTVRPTWTFEVEVKATASGEVGEGPHVKMSLTSSQSTIPVTQDVTLASGSGSGKARVEFEADCTSTAECAQAFKARFERKDTGAGDIALSWTGTISTNVSLSLGQVPPGDLSVTSP